jgi:2-oxoglutarate dehydrogenase E2 component (dihydrolipoamide succinyltransferase)
MAQRMTASHQTIVQATTVADVDMTKVVRLRERIPASFTAFVVKAAAASVSDFPLINAALAQDEIVLHRHVDMGVAVARDDGLVVPVVLHAETKSLADIHWEIEALSERVRSRSLTAEEVRGPTLTVTNSGVFGSLLFTPIIVAPQAATLGMGKVAPTPVVQDGQVTIREIMYLCLSYDHRFLDGAIAVRYLQAVKALLQDPLTLLWDGRQ